MGDHLLAAAVVVLLATAMVGVFIGGSQLGLVALAGAVSAVALFTVRFKMVAPAELRLGRLAAVCGIRSVENSEKAKQFACDIGTTLYLVEFGDGHSVEVAEHFVELVDD